MPIGLYSNNINRFAAACERFFMRRCKSKSLPRQLCLKPHIHNLGHPSDQRPQTSLGCSAVKPNFITASPIHFFTNNLNNVFEHQFTKASRPAICLSINPARISGYYVFGCFVSRYALLVLVNNCDALISEQLYQMLRKQTRKGIKKANEVFRCVHCNAQPQLPVLIHQNQEQ